MDIKESNLTFRFSNMAIKFDDTDYYRKYFNAFPNSKGVDIIFNNSDNLVFLEIKNCSGHESENLWRIKPNNQSGKCPPNKINDDSLDIEVAKKVAMTIACLMGAHTASDTRKTANDLLPFAHFLQSKQISTLKKKILVILFLEGKFESQTRSKKTIMKSLSDSIRQKLKWLNCSVSVVDSDTYRSDIFEII